MHSTGSPFIVSLNTTFASSEVNSSLIGLLHSFAFFDSGTVWISPHLSIFLLGYGPT